jgi:uncharacterized membrane protein YphA (DoxX/SURF4 family)
MKLAALAPDARLGKWLMLALRIAVGGVFIWASVDKIIRVDRFADVVWDYQLLPAGLVNAFAACLPWIELVVGVLLIGGVWLPSGSLLAAGMTVMFMVAIGINLARGPEHFHCGCFGTGQEGAGQGWSLMWRDAILLASCLWLLIASCRRSAQE